VEKIIFFVLLIFCFTCAAEIDPRGFWISNQEDVVCQHIYDPLLSKGLLTFFKKESAQSIVDFGCGMGDYSKVLVSHDFNVEAYDGNPATPYLTGGIGGVIDLSIPFSLGKKYDWVMSLEVGEHIPKEYEQIFIENLMTHCENGILLSWAVEGQGGYGHFNCQNNDYIKNIFSQYGFDNDVEAENFLRDAASRDWFKNTIMVFRKNKNFIPLDTTSQTNEKTSFTTNQSESTGLNAE